MNSPRCESDGPVNLTSPGSGTAPALFGFDKSILSTASLRTSNGADTLCTITRRALLSLPHCSSCWHPKIVCRWTYISRRADYHVCWPVCKAHLPPLVLLAGHLLALPASLQCEPRLSPCRNLFADGRVIGSRSKAPPPTKGMRPDRSSFHVFCPFTSFRQEDPLAPGATA